MIPMPLSRKITSMIGRTFSWGTGATERKVTLPFTRGSTT